jgi:argininosuccinate synthase
MSKKKVVLAFSGGLDTTYCVKYLSIEKDLEVHTVLVNTGGFSKEDLDKTEKHAYNLGSASHTNLDCVEEFYNDAVKYLVFGNILKNHTYPLSVSAERVFQAMAIAKFAKELGADFIAHGSTGAGNDQVRFDFTFSILAAGIEVITPIRDMQLSRQQEIDYLKANGVEASWEKSKYSINKGLWGTSVGGQETLTSNQTLPNEAYPSQLEKEESQTLELLFEKGELKGIDGEKMKPVDAIVNLQAIASKFAVGRGMHVGDTIIGIKGRVGFEAAAPMIIIKGHETLEKHTLTKWQTYWKEQLANWYGMLLHEGQYMDPVMRNIEKFLTDTQEYVTGTVIVKLTPYNFNVVGITSDHDLMNSKFGDYGEMNNAWSGDDVKGFTKILANQTKIYHAVNNK